MIPRINSVSVFPVLLRSTSTLATIALEDMVIIPAIMKTSRIGNPAIMAYKKPKVKFIKI